MVKVTLLKRASLKLGFESGWLVARGSPAVAEDRELFYKSQEKECVGGFHHRQMKRRAEQLPGREARQQGGVITWPFVGSGKKRGVAVEFISQQRVTKKCAMRQCKSTKLPKCNDYCTRLFRPVHKPRCSTCPSRPILRGNADSETATTPPSHSGHIYLPTLRSRSKQVCLSASRSQPISPPAVLTVAHPFLLCRPPQSPRLTTLSALLLRSHASHLLLAPSPRPHLTSRTRSPRITSMPLSALPA